MSDLQAVNSVFNIEIEKIDPNPSQPRKHFSEEALRDLAESIRRYGVMQPITVVRREHETAGGGMATRYEIVAGERRWRASIIAGMATIPAIIREEEESEQDRFELSVLENLQREDLNPVDKARSFQRLVDEFGMRHAEIADKLGKSREYVTNSMRLLDLPDNILDAVSAGEISEGHTRPMLAIKEHPEELQVLFQEIKSKHLTVRQAEATAKSLVGKGPQKRQSTSAYSSHKAIDPEIAALQAQLSDTLGTSVSIDAKDEGGKLTIDFFSRQDLQKILDLVDRQDNTRSITEVPHTTAGAPESLVHEERGSQVNTNQASQITTDDFIITPQARHQGFNSTADGGFNQTLNMGEHSFRDDREERQDIFANKPLNSKQKIDLGDDIAPQNAAQNHTDDQFKADTSTEDNPTQSIEFDAHVDTQAQRNKTTGGNSQEIAQSNIESSEASGVVSKPISDIGDDFIPRVPEEEIGAQLDSPVTEGPYFMPQNTQAQRANPQKISDAQQEGSLAHDVNITMGGMSEHLGIDTTHTQSNEHAQGYNQATSQTDTGSTQAQNQKYDKQDPYRLDNFSI